MDELRNLFCIAPPSGVPIYRQIFDQASILISSGRWPEGSMLPSVRQMALELEVNMMTVSKAYSRLEANGIVERLRGMGMRVNAPVVFDTVAERKAELKPLAEAFVARGKQLGLTAEQIQAVIQSLLKE